MVALEANHEILKRDIIIQFLVSRFVVIIVFKGKKEMTTILIYPPKCPNHLKLDIHSSKPDNVRSVFIDNQHHLNTKSKPTNIRSAFTDSQHHLDTTFKPSNIRPVFTHSRHHVNTTSKPSIVRLYSLVANTFSILHLCNTPTLIKGSVSYFLGVRKVNGCLGGIWIVCSLGGACSSARSHAQACCQPACMGEYV